MARHDQRRLRHIKWLSKMCQEMSSNETSTTCNYLPADRPTGIYSPWQLGPLAQASNGSKFVVIATALYPKLAQQVCTSRTSTSHGATILFENWNIIYIDPSFLLAGKHHKFVTMLSKNCSLTMSRSTLLRVHDNRRRVIISCATINLLSEANVNTFRTIKRTSRSVYSRWLMRKTHKQTSRQRPYRSSLLYRSNYSRCLPWSLGPGSILTRITTIFFVQYDSA